MFFKHRIGSALLLPPPRLAAVLALPCLALPCLALPCIAVAGVSVSDFPCLSPSGRQGDVLTATYFPLVSLTRHSLRHHSCRRSGVIDNSLFSTRLIAHSMPCGGCDRTPSWLCVNSFMCVGSLWPTVSHCPAT